VLTSAEFQKYCVPSNWKEILPIVARYYHWGREESWRATMSELLFWYEAMVRDHQPKKTADPLPAEINDFIKQKMGAASEGKSK